MYRKFIMKEEYFRDIKIYFTFILKRTKLETFFLKFPRNLNVIFGNQYELRGMLTLLFQYYFFFLTVYLNNDDDKNQHNPFKRIFLSFI